MRIFSKFRDYYDGLSSYNDRSWKREESSVILPHNDKRINFQGSFSDFLKVFDTISLYLREKNSLDGKYHIFNFSFERKFLFFCGRIYPVLFQKYNSIKENIYWDFESFRENKYFARAFKHNSLFKIKNTEENAKRLFDVSSAPKSFYSLGIEMNCPIVLIERFNDRRTALTEMFFKLTLNPNLKNINFQKMVSCADAFMQIESYLFNELAENKEKTPNMPNDVKISSHGFDKFSFRKPSSK